MSELRGLHLHVDCASGAAGDMMLGALLDLGVPIAVVHAALDAIGAGKDRLGFTRVTKGGIAAGNVTVDTGGEVAGLGRHHHVAHAPASGGILLASNEDSESTLLLPLSELEQLVQVGATAPPARHPNTTPSRTPRRPTQPPPVVKRIKPDEPEKPDHEHESWEMLHTKPAQIPAIVRAAKPPPASRPKQNDVHHSPATDHAHAHGGDGEHAHYHYADIKQRIATATLGTGVRRRALDIFDRIARAEAKLHGSTVDDVAFHEVGAIDSLVDIVGTAAALDWLGPASVTCAQVAMGHGTVACAHGALPVPSPAALEVLREAGGVIADGGVARELCTPTGAAILASIVTAWSVQPPGRPVAIGWGAGDADLADRPNVLRVVALSPVAKTADTIWQVDANIDDMSPELCAAAADAVFGAGAVDVWWTPITMKKGRPALVLSALASDAARQPVIAAILRETTTIGVRYAQLQRTLLERESVEVTTRFGMIPVKVARDGSTLVNAAPEYDACAAAAKQHDVPVKLVFAAALAAFDRGDR